MGMGSRRISFGDDTRSISVILHNHNETMLRDDATGSKVQQRRVGTAHHNLELKQSGGAMCLGQPETAQSVRRM